MRRTLVTILPLLGWVAAVQPCWAALEPAERPLILAHYMPWFVAKPVSGHWGWHWTMNTFDPDKQRGGKRAIASHYYPLIGPYDSGDPAVLEYHLLLMKLAGIDGVIADWYGLSDHFDYAILHRNTGALLKRAGELGLQFAVCYEDQTIPKLVEAKKVPAAGRVRHVRGELAWLQENWFAEPNYVRVEGKPLFLSFGDAGLTDEEWAEVFRGLAAPPVYVSEQRRRPAAAGAFDWPVPKQYPASLDRFYRQAAGLKPAIPVAFPRFHDIYEEGKAQKGYEPIQDKGGRTWATTLHRALTSKAPAVQLATWNDWGEGTGIEPTVEFGYRDLEVLQRLVAGLVEKDFDRKAADLRLPHRLYRLRQVQAKRPGLKRDLDAAATLLAAGSVTKARAVIERLEKETAR